MIDTELISDPALLHDIEGPWDELAVARSQPMCSPAWMLGWWRHFAPPQARLRVVAVRERGRLIGVAPFFVEENRRGRVDYRLLGYATPRVSPLALPGQEWKVAREIAATLLRARPRPDLVALEQAPLASVWPVALRDGWPGRARPILRQYNIQGSPIVSLRAESFDEWLATRSASFRREIRRHRRRFESLGGAVRASTPQTLHADIAAFMRLHADRWRGRGVSGISSNQDSWTALMREIGSAHLEAGRWRMLMLEIEGEPIAAQLSAAAGGEVVLLNGGWDERFARLSPAMLAMLATIEDAFAHDAKRVDLCPGEQAFKLRIADGNDPVAWSIVMIPGRRLPLTYARSAPMLARHLVREATKRALSDEQTDRVRSLRNQVRRAA